MPGIIQSDTIRPIVRIATRDRSASRVGAGRRLETPAPQQGHQHLALCGAVVDHEHAGHPPCDRTCSPAPPKSPGRPVLAVWSSPYIEASAFGCTRDLHKALNAHERFKSANMFPAGRDFFTLRARIAGAPRSVMMSGVDWDRLNSLRDDIGPEDFADVVLLFFAEIGEKLDRWAR
jgi:hypothetical protein